MSSLSLLLPVFTLTFPLIITLPVSEGWIFPMSTVDSQPLLVPVWNDLFWDHWLLLRYCIMLYISRKACSSEYWHHTVTVLQDWNSFSPSQRPSLFLTSLSSLFSFLHSSKKAAKWCFSSLTYRHQPQSAISQWQKINIWVEIRFVLHVAVIVGDKQRS